MKKIISLITLIFVFAMMIIPSSASQVPISITVNDKYVYTDVNPFLDSGTTFVPIRFVSEALGVDSVEWDNANRTAIIKDGSITIELPTGKNYAYVNGKYVAINEGVRLINSRTFAPIRFISETLGSQVDWEQETFTVKVYKEGVSVPDYLIDNRGYTDEDILWLARIIEAESSGESMSGKIAVGNVILNRVDSSEFPNTIWGVIFDKKYGTQFTPVANGKINNNPSNDSRIAAKRALEGENRVGDSLYFLNPVKAKSSWIISNRSYYSTIGNHSFYL